MVYSFCCAARSAHVENQLLDVLWRLVSHFVDGKGDYKVNNGANKTKRVGLNTGKPVAAPRLQVVLLVYKEDPFVLEDIEECDTNTSNHTGDSTFFVHLG